jgi:hypothetical protein
LQQREDLPNHLMMKVDRGPPVLANAPVIGFPRGGRSGWDRVMLVGRLDRGYNVPAPHSGGGQSDHVFGVRSVTVECGDQNRVIVYGFRYVKKIAAFNPGLKHVSFKLVFQHVQMNLDDRPD